MSPNRACATHLACKRKQSWASHRCSALERFVHPAQRYTGAARQGVLTLQFSKILINFQKNQKQKRERRRRWTGSALFRLQPAGNERGILPNELIGTACCILISCEWAVVVWCGVLRDTVLML